MFDRLYKQIDSNLGWLYQRAKRYKPVSFLIGGVGVAISTGTSLIFPVVAWISNLAAVLSGSLYSILKNFETAESIAEQQRESSLIVESLSLEKYPEEHEQHSLEDTLRQVTALNETEIQNFKARLGKDAIGSSRRYANYNLLAQTSLSLVLTLVNIIANTASSEEKENPASVKNVLNTVTVLLCVLSQYLIHSGYAASGLRRLANETTDLHTRLSSIHESLLFRVRERGAFFKSRQHIEMELMKLSDEVTAIEEQNSDLDRQRVVKMGELNVFNQNYKYLQVQFDGLDIKQYLVGETGSQLKTSLTKDFPKIQNMERLIEYVRTSRNRIRLITEIDLIQSELDRNDSILQQKENKYGQLLVRQQNLSANRNGFLRLNAELIRLDEMRRLFPS